MEQLIKELIKDLENTEPRAAQRLRESLTPAVSAEDLLHALYRMMVSGLIDRPLLLQLLEKFAHAGVMDPEVFTAAIAEAERSTHTQTVKIAAKGTNWWI